MDKRFIGYLCSLVRMDLRKQERALAKIHPHPGQSEEEVEALRKRKSEKLASIRELLESLKEEDK